MNETIALPRLAEIVAQANGCELNAAEKFIRDLFSHIEDTLAVDGSVTISGLGTFVRTSDSENPVVFTLDAALASVINEPFAIFEPVPVNGVDFWGEVKEQATPTVISQQITETEATATNESESVNKNETKEIEIPAQVIEEKEETTVQMPAVQDIEPQVSSQQSVEPQIIYVEAPYRYWIWSLIFLTGLVLGIAIGFCAGEKFRAIFTPQETAVIAPDEDNEPTEDIAVPATILETDTIRSADEETTPEPAVEKQPVRSEIFDTVSPNRFLTTMARQYYGPMEYWAFIYEANADILGNPNRIKPGTRVRIPDVSEFAANEAPEATLARAKALGRSIYARFDQ